MKLLISFFFILFLLNSINAQDKFIGRWSIKKIISDPDSMVKPINLKDTMVIEKVNDDYYRCAVNNNSLLFKLVNENTLYSNFSPDRIVTTTWKSENIIEVNALVVITSDHDHQHGSDDNTGDHNHNSNEHNPVIMIWERIP